MAIMYFAVICFVILSTLTFTQGSIRLGFRHDEASKSFEVDDTDAGRSNHTNVRVHRATDSDGPEGSVLAENTPVWIAYYANPNNKVLLTYRKLEKGIVKEAINYWESDKFHGFSKKERSIDDSKNLLKEDRGYFIEREDTNDVWSLASPIPDRPKRETEGNVYHPSVLVIVEYGDTWPSNEHDERKLILERIIYVLAYWNSVDIQLRPIENPWVRLRLGGIVIGRDRDATHHLFELYGNTEYLHYEGSLQRMNEYWGDKMRQKIDFQRGTYNIVTLMTDEKQAPEKSDVVALSTDGMLCNRDKPGAAGIIITYDDLKFSGINRILQLVARMLGHGSDIYSSCRYKKHWDSRAWDACNLDSIRKSLESNGWCMKEPPVFHDPGKPVEKVLPGSFMSFDEQCNAIGPDSGNVCPAAMCHALQCQSKSADYACVFWKPAMDGSACGPEMICLDGKCVSNRRLVNEIPWW